MKDKNLPRRTKNTGVCAPGKFNAVCGSGCKAIIYINLLAVLSVVFLALAPDNLSAQSQPDVVPPRGDIYAPAGTLIKGSTIRIALFDPDPAERIQSEIDLKSIALRVGGRNVTQDAYYFDEGNRSERYPVGPDITGTPLKSAFGILNYDIERNPRSNNQSVPVVLTVRDLEGNRRQIKKNFRFMRNGRIDQGKPGGALSKPRPGTVVRNDKTAISFRISDPPGRGRRSLLDLTSIVVTVDGRNVTSEATYYHRGDRSKSLSIGPDAIKSSRKTSDQGEIVYRPSNKKPLPWGFTELVVRASDNEGNSQIIKSNITVKDRDSPITSSPSVTPITGVAPLTVRFKPDYEVVTAARRFEWDFDGDGKYDVSEAVGIDQRYQYTEPGRYLVRLRVTDSSGRRAISILPMRVANAKPEVTASASPSNGAVPLTVSFSVSATDNEGIKSYAWDFDGDGSIDYRSSTSGNTTHTYRRVGTRNPVLRVTDERGLTTKKILPTTTIKAGKQGTPSVSLSASPSSGTAPLDVRFSARATGLDGQRITNYSWDFNGDGKFDLDTTEPFAETTYQAARIWYPRVRVTTSQRKRSVDTIAIPVDADVKLTMSTDTLRSIQGRKVVVITDISGAVKIGINIENASGNVVRRLLKPRRRRAGQYKDRWDGRDDAGRLVADDVYYAVANYEAGGRKIRLDLRDTTGGVAGNPSRNTLDPTFSPFAGEPLRVDFELETAAEVTAFIGLLNVDTRFVTFHRRKPLGRGIHTILWNGESAEGRLVHPPTNDRFLFGVFQFSLPDNAVVVENAVQVSDLGVKPTIFNPAPGKNSILNFTLSRPAEIELVVVNAETGNELGRRKYKRVGAGRKRIRWDGRIRVNGVSTLVAAGRYRLGVTAIASNGSRSMTNYIAQQVYY